ncbi:MAG: mechanosensitive ion channel family protein, partial [Salinivirgaceae bacterium]|nr:mechanosensitive ion channel family protein [Salinivirgaceae bacterium]
MQNFVLFGANGYDWLKAIIAIVVSLAVSKLLRWLVVVLFKRFSKMPGDKAKETVESCIMPLCLLIIVIGIRLAISNFPIQDIRPTIGKIYTVLACLSITWFFSKTLTAIISGVITSRNPDGKNSVSMMLPTIMHLVQIIIWGVGIAITLDNTGYDVKALIAGLGFGGVALALAAKNTVTNFLGGATLLVDNPFSIGDRVRVAGYDGFVRFIGLRSFRLTTLDGTEVTIPNANIIDNAIENVTREPSRRIVLSLQLTYGTTTA